MSLTIDELETFARQLAADTAGWQPLVDHHPDRRTYVLLYEDEHVNAWVLCWSADHDTGFHDHDESAAAVVVLEGEVREDRLCLNGPPQTRIGGAGDALRVPANAIHRVLHHGDRPAVTIHAYSPPLIRMGAYAIGAGGELLRESRDGTREMQAELAAV